MDSLDTSDMTDTSDHHICYRCKQTITGLDNYLAHRKANACEPMTAFQYFNSLQLQHKCATDGQKPVDDYDRHDSPAARVDHNTDDEDEVEDEEEDDDDIYRPPRNFTGAKWKPGWKCDTETETCGQTCGQLESETQDSPVLKPFDCEQCGKAFTTNSCLRTHEKSHTAIRDKKCHVCGASFALNKVLKRHLLTHETNRERSLVCDICGANFFSKHILAMHTKRHLPKSERQFKCPFDGCRYAFVQKNELVEHEKVHTSPADKPYLCDQCPYKTKSIFTFRKHYRMHTGEKPFKCQSCDYATALSSNLVRHSRVHSGHKPYKCPYCSYSCNTQENIRKHILKTKKHSGLFVYPCKHCSYGTNIFNEYHKHIEDRHSDLYTENEIDSLVSHLFVKQKDSIIDVI